MNDPIMQIVLRLGWVLSDMYHKAPEQYEESFPMWYSKLDDIHTDLLLEAFPYPKPDPEPGSGHIAETTT